MPAPKPAKPVPAAPNARTLTGQRGEALAARWLERHGWHIVGRNLRRGRREADIVARRSAADGRVLAVVEVKTARESRHPAPASVLAPRDPADLVLRLGAAQRRRLWSLAQELGREHNADVLQVLLITVLLGPNRESLLVHEVPLEDW